MKYINIIKKNKFIRKIYFSIKAFYLYVSVLLTGYQQYFHNYLYYKFLSIKRDKNFKKNGHELINLISASEWKEFSKDVSKSYLDSSELKPTPTPGHINLRQYIDHKDPIIYKHIDKILTSEDFRRQVSKYVGDSFIVSNVQIWRNLASSFKVLDEEVNSSFYHFDNGNEGKDKAVVNIFMYLSNVTNKNGPFTFYNPSESRLINRKFAFKILKNFNLRERGMLPIIESVVSPKTLICNPGEALVIDNQICMHRAGFCYDGYRDIIEIMCRPK